MLILDPYQTTYGKNYNMDNLKKSLVTYLSTHDLDGLKYEYSKLGLDSKTEIAIITGCNHEELSLPYWDHPILVKTIRNIDVVVVDVRKYVRTHNTQVRSISEITKNSSNTNFIISRGLITVDFLDGNYGYYRNIMKNIATGFGIVMSTVCNIIINLTPSDKVNVEVASAAYIFLLTTDDNVEPKGERLINQLGQCRFSIPLSTTVIKDIVNRLEIGSKDVNGLLMMIKSVLPEEIGEMINVTTLTAMYGGIWSGPGDKETLYISLDHLPTWIALLYNCLVEVSFKHAKLTNIINSNKNKINKDNELTTTLGRHLKEKTNSYI